MRPQWKSRHRREMINLALALNIDLANITGRLSHRMQNSISILRGGIDPRMYHQTFQRTMHNINTHSPRQCNRPRKYKCHTHQPISRSIRLDNVTTVTDLAISRVTATSLPSNIDGVAVPMPVLTDKATGATLMRPSQSH